MSDEAPPRLSQDLRPIPDPTVLTTAALLREISALKALMEARMDGTDKAVVLLQASLDRAPSDVDLKVAHLQALHEEKFNSVQRQFAERDTRVESTARDSKLAIDAALNAAKEAVAKSESATKEQINQIGQLIQAETRSSNEKIAGLQSRLDRGEGKGSGYSAAWGIAVAGVGTLLGIGGLVLALTR